MRLLVGLGNPGPEYERHRHNVGFMVLEAIHRHYGFGPWKRRFQGLTAEGFVDGDKTLLLKPLTYMNLSGQSVGEAARFFRLVPDQIIVFHDELDVGPGRVRVKQGGGHGGHNGLRSIDDHLGKDYWRVRIGIGHPGDKAMVTGWVLSNFAKADEPWLTPLLDILTGELPLLCAGHADRYANRIAALTQPVKPSKAPAAAKQAAPDSPAQSPLGSKTTDT